MERAFRISVRELVAFSCFEPDITPTADTEALLTGTLAHKARQSLSDAQTEQTIKHLYTVGKVPILVHGRMDLFTDGEIPFVEEIKHCRVVPDAVRPEHRMQAMCYAAMLSEEKMYESVRFSVCYVNLEGEILRSFAETLAAAELHSEMDALLQPYARYAVREAEHKGRRDISLKELTFPFQVYRKGQRELAVQVYTAISRKKRLFASLPTGTGKSAAVLFPSLKALGEGNTERVVYLTARNTARQSPLNALRRMMEQGMMARCTVLTAKEKLCPNLTRCHPDDCPRAKGHFLRQGDAIDALLESGEMLWDEAVICRHAERFQICPFEFALALCEIADVIMMDLNYAFDPFAQVRRLFQKKKNFTLLVDEAHHTIERVRESLSGTLSTYELITIRREYGKQYGRKNSIYRSLSHLIQQMKNVEGICQDELAKEQLDMIANRAQTVLDEAFHLLPQTPFGLSELIRILMPFLYAYEHLDDDYAVLSEQEGSDIRISIYCLFPGKEIARVTKGLKGTVFFSATLHPLPAMKQLLGGNEEDACFSLPSPFPQEHLAVVRKRIGTRFHQREHTAQKIASAIEELLCVHSGNTMVYFPSYAYMGLVLQELDPAKFPKLLIQSKEMGEESREEFLSAFEREETILGFCVLGGLFSEGIDLPGDKLVNAVVVGVGLPVPSIQLNAIRNCYEQRFGNGFFYACLIPAMQKVLQAAGRVIRSESDKGMVLLLDDRYYDKEYEALLPYDWIICDEDINYASQTLKG